MKTNTASILAFLLLPAAAWTQGRLYDKVNVDFPDDVNVAGTVVPAGHYEIRQFRNSAGGARVLFLTKDGGTRFEAAGATIPILDNLTPNKTRVVLQRIGGTYYLSRVWIDGKDYGYEYPLPADAKTTTASNEPISLTATYRADEAPVVAQAQPEPAPEPQRAPERTPAPVQAAPQAEPTPQPQPPPVPQPQAATEPVPEVPMPSTADNWAVIIMGGVVLAGAGFLLRARRLLNNS